MRALFPPKDTRVVKARVALSCPPVFASLSPSFLVELQQFSPLFVSWEAT